MIKIRLLHPVAISYSNKIYHRMSLPPSGGVWGLSLYRILTPVIISLPGSHMRPCPSTSAPQVIT